MTSGQFEHVRIDQIWVDRENRQRYELKDIDVLAASIRDNGLIHPPIITREGKLVTGERRLTACIQLGMSTIPVQWSDEIDPQALHILELEENVRRLDLTWQEQCEAVQAYHKAQLELDSSWTQTKTAEALNFSRRHVDKYLGVAEAMSSGNERVMNAPKLSTAIGIVTREKQRKQSAAAASLADVWDDRPAEEKEAEAEATAEPSVPLLHADFHEWASSYSGAKFNFIHCDFPYGVNADRHAQGQAASQGGYADSADIYWGLLSTLEVAMKNVVAEHAHLMFWFSMDYYEETRSRLSGMGWKVNPFPLIWHKNDNTGILPDPQRGPRRGYETAFLALRGEQLIVQPVNNIVAHPGRDKSIHMSEKPRVMLRHFFRMFVDEYTYMLDPTCGSGNSVRVAEDMGAKRMLGLERDEEFFTRAKEAYYDDGTE